jgi:hypothetical protein
MTRAPRRVPQSRQNHSLKAGSFTDQRETVGIDQRW